MNVSVILPAAGLGTRMGREKSGTSLKQFMLLEGAPILIHTIRKFLLCPSVTEIVVALRAEDMDWARGLIHQEHPAKPVHVVEGGESRQQSVENALKTPQVFQFELLKRAFDQARKDGFTGTDESSLVERLEEIDVHVVQGSDRNIKITKPTDMELARLFLSEEVGETAS
jgi:2-C-methyl-D-erythritol 4-phosphate cytidylyltransferase